MNLQITDVTLRDGLQSEAKKLNTEEKFRLFEAINACGFARVEVTSFVHPKWIPQLADSKALCELVFSKSTPNQPLMAFVPNEKGLDRLLEFPIEWAGAFVAVSETFNKKNVNATIEESIQNLKAIKTKTQKGNRKLRVYVSTVFGCPYEGGIALEQVMRVLKQLVDVGADEIALSDTIGVARPQDVQGILESFGEIFPIQNTALHLHNTYGMALANAQKGHDLGVRLFDGATGGVGGCPYAKGASGNLPSEELAYYFREKTSLNFKKLQETMGVLGELQLSTSSHLVEILKKGGALYGV